MNRIKVVYKDDTTNVIVSSEQYVKSNDNIKEYFILDSITFPEQEDPIIKLQQENNLLKAQLKAQTERSDFIEDCIAEMAGVVYNTEETAT